MAHDQSSDSSDSMDQRVNNKRVFRLRTLILFVTVCAFSIWVASEAATLRARQATLKEMDGNLPLRVLSYADKQPSLLRRLLGDRLVSKVQLPESDAHWRSRLLATFPEAQIEVFKAPLVADRPFFRDVVGSRELLSQHSDLGYHVRFVVPKGYRGVLTVSEDRQNGHAPTVGADGEYLYVIPRNGHLVTSIILPLITKCERRAEFSDGEVIAIDGDGAECTFRRLPFVVDQSFRGMIGTEQDVADWLATHEDWSTVGQE